MAAAPVKRVGRLSGKTIVLTAAAQGIGRACVDAFYKEGAKVIATDLEAQKSKLDALAAEYKPEAKAGGGGSGGSSSNCGSGSGGSVNEAGGSVETYFVDVTNKETIRKLGEKIDECHVLFNCAGVVMTDSILTLSDSGLETVMSINVRGMIWMIQEFLPKMLSQKYGVIINMSSVCSSIKGAPNRSSYGISKAAVIGLTKSVAADYIDRGVRCNCICPGTVETESWRERVGSAENPQEAKKQFIARQPMGRIGSPEEIANVVVLLASDESAFMTGSEIIIDGGWTNVHRN